MDKISLIFLLLIVFFLFVVAGVYLYDCFVKIITFQNISKDNLDKLNEEDLKIQKQLETLSKQLREQQTKINTLITKGE